MPDTNGPVRLDALAEIKARTAAASPGPWRAGPNHLIGGWWVQNEDSRQREGALADFVSKADAEFIAHARTDVPVLVGTLESALREIVRLEQRLKERG